MSLIEIVDVLQPSQLGTGLVRGYVDAPKNDSEHEVRTLQVIGWAIGRASCRERVSYHV